MTIADGPPWPDRSITARRKKLVSELDRLGHHDNGRLRRHQLVGLGRGGSARRCMPWRSQGISVATVETAFFSRTLTPPAFIRGDLRCRRRRLCRSLPFAIRRGSPARCPLQKLSRLARTRKRKAHAADLRPDPAFGDPLRAALASATLATLPQKTETGFCSRPVWFAWDGEGLPGEPGPWGREGTATSRRNAAGRPCLIAEEASYTPAGQSRSPASRP